MLFALFISQVVMVATNVTSPAPRIFAPGVISGPAHDAAPAFSPDGKTVYFSRNNSQLSVILVSHFDGRSWSAPEVAPFSGTWMDFEPAMSPDGSFLIFVSNRPSHPGGAVLDGTFNGTVHPGRGGNLWKVERSGAGWSEPRRLPDVVNRSSSIFAPCVVQDGSVYFMEPWPATGHFRIFRSQFRDGRYREAEPVVFSDGTWQDVDPAFAPDESFVVFGSRRPPAQNSIDLFIAFRRNGKWGAPVHLGNEVNSPTSDAEARLGPDHRTLYFSSDRVVPVALPQAQQSAQGILERMQSWDNGLYNIWQVDLGPWLEGAKAP